MYYDNNSIIGRELYKLQIGMCFGSSSLLLLQCTIPSKFKEFRFETKNTFKDSHDIMTMTIVEC